MDVEEGAIATAFKKLAADELERLYPLKATAEAQRLPILPMLSEYQQTLIGIQSSASDDCVRILTENGSQFAETRDKVREIRECWLGPITIGLLRQSRLVSEQVWQRLASYRPSPEIAARVEQLKSLLGSEHFIESWDEIVQHTDAVLAAYKKAYVDLFDRRRNAYESAIEEIKNRYRVGAVGSNESRNSFFALVTVACPSWQ